jgi:AcrR family transcriptional regulator
VSRRDEIIAVAATILRESGPAALTSVNVAKRVGISQPAIYRHIDGMDDLIGVASRIVVSEITAALHSILLGPRVDYDDLAGIAALGSEMVTVMHREAQAFEIVDRWRFAEGELGEGIREVMESARDLVAFVLEEQWRREYGYDEPLPLDLVTIQLAHASVMLDEIVSVARLVRHGARHDDAVRLAQLRIVTAWIAYVVDMQTRLGRPVPTIEIS